MKENINFYCQHHSGHEDFSIDEWNEVNKELQTLPLTEKEKQDILFPEPCKKQCQACINIIIDQRIKTQKLISKMKDLNKFTSNTVIFIQTIIILI